MCQVRAESGWRRRTLAEWGHAALAARADGRDRPWDVPLAGPSWVWQGTHELELGVCSVGHAPGAQGRPAPAEQPRQPPQPASSPRGPGPGQRVVVALLILHALLRHHEWHLIQGGGLVLQPVPAGREDQRRLREDAANSLYGDTSKPGPQAPTRPRELKRCMRLPCQDDGHTKGIKGMEASLPLLRQSDTELSTARPRTARREGGGKQAVRPGHLTAPGSPGPGPGTWAGPPAHGAEQFTEAGENPPICAQA